MYLWVWIRIKSFRSAWHEKISCTNIGSFVLTYYRVRRDTCPSPYLPAYWCWRVIIMFSKKTPKNKGNIKNKKNRTTLTWIDFTPWGCLQCVRKRVSWQCWAGEKAVGPPAGHPHALSTPSSAAGIRQHKPGCQAFVSHEDSLDLFFLNNQAAFKLLFFHKIPFLWEQSLPTHTHTHTRLPLYLCEDLHRFPFFCTA